MAVDVTRTTEVTPEVVDTVKDIFKYHPWDQKKIDCGEKVRAALQGTYLVILEAVPACSTRTRALNKLVEARMDANAAITHDGKY